MNGGKRGSPRASKRSTSALPLSPIGSPEPRSPIALMTLERLKVLVPGKGDNDEDSSRAGQRSAGLQGQQCGGVQGV